MEASLPLPVSSSGLSHRLRGFLDEHFKTPGDLLRSHSLVAQLGRECADMEIDLLELRRKLSVAAATWASRSKEVGRILRQRDPGPECPVPFPSRDRNVEPVLPPRVRRILGVELPLLAKEVGRIETVRLYAETTLQLEVLVGDLEDAASFIVDQISRNMSFSFSKASNTSDTGSKEEKLLLAIKSMKDIENVLVGVASRRPRWIHLLMAVDSRVENILAVLRPRALTDHRALLASLGWPPSLSKSNLEKEKYLDIPNPLVLMQGEKKETYSQSFLALCALQHLQAQREARKHDLDKQTCVNCSLWTIDELVHPIASRMESHFSRWSDQPKFIFALVYKTTRDFLGGVDDVLQPLIDRARLVGYSAKEAWVSAMVKMLSEYLTTGVFPLLVRSYDGTDGNMEVNSSWLHLVDLMVAFDKRMQILASSETTQMGPFTEVFLPSLSVLSIFNDHPDWLKIWAMVELKDATDKLKSDLEDERSWSIDIRQQDEFSYREEVESFLLSTREDYKAPLIADSVVIISWAMIERGRALPNKPMRIQFIRSSASIFLKHFFILLERRQEMEFMTAVIENDALLRVAASVNTALYCESILREWSEDVNFLEMSITEDEFMGGKEDDPHSHSPFFGDEIMFLVKLETDCLVEIMSALLLHFEALCWDYVQNIEQWEAEEVESGDQTLDEENLSVSPGFVEALEMLKDRIRVLKLNLNSKDFLDLWRSITGGLDHFIFNSIVLSVAKFSCRGVNQFRVDMRALFFTFRPFCARPEAFFPCTSDSLKLLTMNRNDLVHLLNVPSSCRRKSEECLRLCGLFHVSASQADKILRKKFGR